MDIYGNTGKTLPQKTVLMVLQTIFLAIAVWLLLFGGLEAISKNLPLKWNNQNIPRRIFLTAGICITYVRMAVTIFILLKRSMSWEEAFSIPFAFALYYVGFPLFAGANDSNFAILGIAGIIMFLAGSAINTGSELLRDQWKKDPAHKGKLYTGGLFRYSMHVNYFGDLLWVSGLALMTGNPWALIIPGLLFCFFAFYNAPLLDRHLAEKYGKEFDEYRAETKKIIPFIY